MRRARKHGRHHVMESLESRALLTVQVWDAGGVGTNWSNPLNWVNDVAPSPGDDLQFPPADPAVVNDYPAGTMFKSIWVTGDTSVRISGNPLTLTHGVIAGAGADLELDLPITLAGTQWFTGNGDTFLVSGGVNTGDHTLSFNGSAAFRVTAPISGAGAVQLQSTGGGSLEAANTHSGATVVSSGTWTLALPAGQPGSAAGTGPIMMSGGVLNLGGNVPGNVNVTGGTLSAAPLASLQSGLTLGPSAGVAVSLSGPDAGPGGYNRLDVAGEVRLGGGRLQLTNNFAGASIGQTFAIINNDGADPVQGQFATLAQGGIVSSNGGSFQINYAGGDGNDVTLTRVDANPATVQFAATSYSVAEGGAVTVTVSRTGGTGPASATWAAADGTARREDDFSPGSGTLDFPQGVTQQTFVINARGDGVGGEGEETFSVNLFAGNNATAGAATTAQVRITNADNQGIFTLSELGVTADESAGAALLTLVRGSGTAGGMDVTLRLEDVPGGAVPGEDFPATPVVVSFAPGEATKVVAIPIIDDAAPEAEEQFIASIQSVNNGGALGDPSQTQTTITIPVNDSPGILALAGAEFRGHESTRTATVTVTRGGTGVGTVGFGYTLMPVAVAAQRPVGVATPGDDYDPASGTVSIPEGQTSVTFTVPIVDDALGEGDERFEVALTNLTGGAVLASPATAQASLVITDDDVPGPFVMGPDPAAPNELALFFRGTEGPDKVRFAVRRRDGLLLAYLNRRLAGTFAPPSRIIVETLGGNDRVSAAKLPVQLRVDAGDGDDVVTGSNAGDVLIGGVGNDRLSGGRGRDLLFGDAGGDRLSGGADDDVLVAGQTTLQTNLPPGDLRTVSADMAGLWSGTGDYASRVAALRADTYLPPGASIDDEARDVVAGQAGTDLLFAHPNAAGLTGDRVARPATGELLVSRPDQ